MARSFNIFSNREEFINHQISKIENGKFVEIGVYQGNYSREILKKQ
jgi:hypothetical protein